MATPFPRLVRTCLAATATLGALVVIAPRAATNHRGGSVGQQHWLSLSQRDVRVFNNFQDTAANGNGATEPEFPGYTGAPLAIWKAVVEWGSTLHGTGAGDPSQPGDLGSGNASFDPSWQGDAPTPGNVTSNVASEISGNGNGVLAFALADFSGWQIRFYENWNWDDGPGTSLVNLSAWDIQGVMTHEYGHALGIGHLPDTNATMHAVGHQVGQGIPARSIEPADVTALQQIYGIVLPTKPRIEGVAGGGALVISGQNFDPTGNEVWFTRAGGSPAGDPVVVTGLVSTAGGTRIALVAPPEAGPGDVLVRVAGSQGWALSNAWPYDPGACPTPVAYCTAKTNSQGCVPAMGFDGVPSLTPGVPFSIEAASVLNNKTGLLFYGFTQGANAFQGGIKCVLAPTRRTPLQDSGGNPPPDDCSGSYAYDFNARIQSGVDPQLTAGAVVYAQYWSRDPASQSTTGLTDGLCFTICP